MSGGGGGGGGGCKTRGQFVGEVAKLRAMLAAMFGAMLISANQSKVDRWNCWNCL